MTERFVHYHKGTPVQTQRTLVQSLPLKLQFQNVIDLDVDISVEVAESNIFDVVTALVVSVPNLEGNANVDISLTTIVDNPWEFDTTYFQITDDDDLVQDGSESMILEGEQDCETYETSGCTQNLKLSFISTGVCDQQGSLA